MYVNVGDGVEVRLIDLSVQTGGVLLFLLAAGDVGGQLEEGHPVPTDRLSGVPGGDEDRPGDRQW